MVYVLPLEILTTNGRFTKQRVLQMIVEIRKMLIVIDDLLKKLQKRILIICVSANTFVGF